MIIARHPSAFLAAWALSCGLLLAIVAGPALAQSTRLDAPALPGAPGTDGIEWHRVGPGGTVEVLLYYFWSPTCRYCAEARPVIDAMTAARPWLRLVALEVTDRQNVRRYQQMAQALGEKPRGVPAFFLCGRMAVGWDAPEGVGTWLAAVADECHLTLQQAQPLRGMERAPGAPALRLPWVGEVSSTAISLPVLTLVLGGLDAFNPCAFFVLLFLLSLLVHARSRVRMLLVGGTFVLFSGLIYFAFMAAWLNLFLVMSGLGWVTAAAGLLALGAGGLNVKDYVRPGQGPSLSIPEGAKPGLFARMRGLLSAERLPTMLAATAVLAVAANGYELLCTSGFPMVYTRVLTLRELPLAAYYGWLAAYNVVYVVPLALIVSVFAWTLGRHKLTEGEGRLLKLTSGLMMVGLGILLLTAPDWLENPLAAGGLLVAAIGAAAMAHTLERRRPPDGRT